MKFWRKIKIWGRLTVVALLLSFQYQNCSSYSDPNPFELGTSKLSSIAPEAIVLALPDASLNSRSSGPDGEFAISLGGACNLGMDAVSHRIEIQMSALVSNYQEQPLVINANCRDDDLSDSCTKLTNIKCEHGRYHFIIPGQRAKFCPFGYSHQAILKIKGQLVLIDSNGVEIRPQTAAFQDVTYNYMMPDSAYNFLCPH